VKASRGVLVAGIGNVFLGDDGFGVEVAQRLIGRGPREGVRVVDFGIRGLDLAYALEEHEAAILVDATPRGRAPGTLYVLEPLVGAAEAGIDAHSMTPERVLAALAPEARPRVVRLVGCEPLTLEPDEDAQGLSPPVSRAVDEAVQVVERLAGQLLARIGGADA
jgi:hydrogenase maturation protease